MYKYPKSIGEAAKLLDEAYPNWWNIINIESLNMQTGTRCILGQLYENYLNGRNSLFFGNDNGLMSDAIFGNMANTKEWISEIEQRRNYKTNLMNFEQALALMREGKKVARKGWKGYYHWPTVSRKGCIINNFGRVAMISQDDIIANDWQEFKFTKLSQIKKKHGFKMPNCDKVYIKVGDNMSWSAIDENYDFFTWTADIDVIPV